MMTRAQCRYCLACLAFYYPLFLLASFLVQTLPVLLRSAINGQTIERVDAGVRGLQVRVTGAPRARPSTGVTLAIAGSLLLLLWLAPKRLRPITGLFLAIAATSTVFFWRDPIWLTVLVTGLYFHMRSVRASWWARLLAIFAVFVLPASILALFGMRGGFWMPGLQLAILPVAACLAVAATGRESWQHAAIDVHSWKPALTGLFVTLLAVSGLSAHESSRAAADRALRQERLAQVSASTVPAPVSPGPIFFQKGVNFTSEGWAHYGTETSIQTLRQVHAKGVDSIALVPYGGGRAQEPRIRYGNPGMEPDDGIAILTGVAHQLGMKVMLKPQLWVNPGGFPGAVNMPDEASTREWFAQYAGFAEYYARLAEKLHIDIYCVGTEFVQMSRHADEWRKVIARVRAIYRGPLVYAATQGPEFENLAFWDALDYIGLNNYYPLPDDFSAAEVVRKVESVQARFRKPVLLTEAGYVSMEWPNRAPWDETPRALSMEHQSRGYEAIYRAFWDKPWFAGIYWWRVGSNGEGGPQDGKHTPWGKPAMDVVSRYYAQAPQARSVAIR